MREHGVPAVHRRRAPLRARLRRVRPLVLHRARLHQHAHRPRPRRHPAARGRPHRRATRSSSPAATRRSTPSRSPTSSTPPSSATASRPCWRSPTSSATGRPRAAPAVARELLLRLARTGGVYVPGVLRRRLPARRPDPARRPGPTHRRAVARVQAHRHGPRRVALPQAAARAARRVGARAHVGRDLPRLHPRLPVLPGRHDHPPGARAVASPASARWSSAGWPRPGSRRSGLLSLSQRRPLRDRRHHQGPGRPLRGHPDRPVAAVDPRRRVQHRPRQRADPQRPPLRPDVRPRGRLRADPQGHQQDGHRGRPHQRPSPRPTAPAGGRSSSTSCAACRPRPTRTCCRSPSSPSGSSRPAAQVSGRRDIRCTVSIGGFVPKPHTPFQWVGQLGAEETDARLAKLREAIRSDQRYGSAIGFRYHDGQPGIVEGLLSRGDRRVGQVIEAVWRDGGRFDGWSEHFSYERWMRCAAEALGGRAGRRRLVHHPRARAVRGAALGPPRLRARQGVALGGLAGRPRRDRGRRLPLDARASTAACARRWAPRSRSAPPARRCCPLTVVNAGRDQLLESR